jgi:hypothetical protein
MTDKRHQATIVSERVDPPSVTFRWVRPEFEAVDGIGPNDSLATMGGLVLAFGSVDDAGASIVAAESWSLQGCS